MEGDDVGEDRRSRIAEAAVRVLATEGLRGLTHRAVDREAGLPSGSTSYYVSTRTALLQLVAERLAERTRDDVGALFAELAAGAPTSGDGVAALAGVLARFVRRLAARGDDHRARFALLIDVADRDEVRSVLEAATPASAEALAAMTDAFRAYGVEVDGAQAVQLLRFADALLFSLVTGGDGLDVEGMVRAQLTALG